MKAKLTKEEKRAKRLEYEREWRKKNPDYFKNWSKNNSKKVKEYHRNYAKNNPDTVKRNLDRNKEKRKGWIANWKKKNPEKCREYNRISHERKREENNARSKRWREKNPEKVKENNRKYREDKREQANEASQRYSQNNREKINAKTRQYYISHPEEKVVKNIRIRITKALRGIGKLSKTEELLGCSMAFFKAHVESKFQPEMTWDNYGMGKDKWVIDHIVPIALFPDLSQEWQQKSAFNWQNLQPMWFLENCSKNDKLETCPV